MLIGHAKVRDVVSRLNCQNNVRLIGIALQNYQASLGCYPPATMPNPDLPPQKRFSWFVAIYPHVEASPIHYQLDKKAAWDVEQNHFAAVTPILFYQCPAVYPLQDPDSEFAPTSYMGIAGVGPDTATLPKEDPWAGFFGYDRKLDQDGIKGRTSTLLVLAETSRTSGTWIAGGKDTVRGLEAGSPYLGARGQFGGLHRAGANVLMADGSVHFLANETGPDVLEAMARLHADE